MTNIILLNNHQWFVVTDLEQAQKFVNLNYKKEQVSGGLYISVDQYKYVLPETEKEKDD